MNYDVRYIVMVGSVLLNVHFTVDVNFVREGIFFLQCNFCTLPNFEFRVDNFTEDSNSLYRFLKFFLYVTYQLQAVHIKLVCYLCRCCIFIHRVKPVQLLL
jgi:hypothetical protein